MLFPATSVYNLQCIILQQQFKNNLLVSVKKKCSDLVFFFSSVSPNGCFVFVCCLYLSVLSGTHNWSRKVSHSRVGENQE